MKKLLFILVTITVLIAVLIYSLEPLTNYYLRNKASSLIVDKPKLSIDSLHFSPFQNTLFVKNINYKDSSKGILLNHLDVKIKGISYLKLLLNKEVELDSLILINPQLTFEQNDKETDNKDSSNSKNNIKGITINNLKLTDAVASYQQPKSKLKASIKKFQLQAKSVEYNPSKPLSYGTFSGILSEIELDQEEKFKVRIDSLNLSDQNLDFYNMKFSAIPSQKYQSTEINAEIGSSRINYSFDSLYKFQYFKSPMVQLSDFKMEAYMDKRLPPKPGKKKLIAEMLHAIKSSFKIDSLLLENGRIQYEERIEKSPTAGKVYFTNFNASITNITNDSNSINNNKTMLVSSSCNLMNEGKLTSNIEIDLNSKSQYQHISGSLDSMNLTALNPTFLPLAFIKFEHGQLDKLEFDYYLNRTKSEGNIQFYYHDLKVIIQNRKIFKRPKALSKVETFLANTFLFRSNNPNNGNFKEGVVAFERDSSKSVFNYWWKSLFSGMTYTLVNNPTQ